ncbi:HutI Imidazolonepropionase and related amidohydrolases [Candidatus Nanopelagicaceae bacterium]
MSSIAFTNIETLVTNDFRIGDGTLGVLHGASLVVEDGLISQITQQIPSGVDSEIDCSGQTLLPGFVDSHTHLIFAGDRADEFSARSRGEKYSAGGITSTVAATRAASDAALSQNAQRLLDEALASGTTTIEIKSGYGLTERDELRSIEIAKRFTDETTLLAAHVIPFEFKEDPDAYVALIIDSIIPASSAKWIDVFCDQGAFSPEQSEAILRAGIAQGMLPRIHANQLTAGKGVELAVALGASSADHLSKSTQSDIELLASSNTVATLLPGAEFSTHLERNLGRKLLDAGARVAIASDCNPGSSYTTSMPFCIASAVSLLGFTCEEAVLAATLGGAQALRREDIGQLAIGKKADLVLLDAPSYIHLAYRPGVNLIHSTYKSGRAVTSWQK